MSRERLVRVYYQDEAVEKYSACASIDGALRAALIRVYNEQFACAMIYDWRFTTEPDFSDRTHVLTVQRYRNAVHVTWAHARPTDE